MPVKKVAKQVVDTYSQMTKQLQDTANRLAPKKEQPKPQSQSQTTTAPKDETKKLNAGEVGVYRDSKTGELSGVEIDGKTYLGLNPDEVREIVERKREKTELPTGAYDIGEREKARQIDEITQGAQGLTQENIANLSDISFTPEERVGSDIPGVGGTAAVADLLFNQWGDDGILGTKQPRQAEDILLQEEVLKRAAQGKTMSNIEIEVYKRGLSESQKFGAMIEAIPVFGKLTNQWLRGLIETPSSAVEKLESQLDTEIERASILSKSGLDPVFVSSEITAIELNVKKLQAKMKLLIGVSAELRSQPETVNELTEKIYNKLVLLEGYKLGVIAGNVGQ
jgi:hypothetical protein